MANAELLAEQIWPGDQIRRGFRVFLVERVEISAGDPVRVTVHRIGGQPSPAAPAEHLLLAVGELVTQVRP